MIEKLVHAPREIFLVRAASQSVEFVVVVEKVDLLAVATQRQEVFNRLVPGDGVIAVVVENQQWSFHAISEEHGRVFEIKMRRLLHCRADPALRLLVLELP